jgi:hypothetical protein
LNVLREPVVWPWCNLAVSQRRRYCATANSHSSKGPVSRLWDGTDWPCVLYNHSHSQISYLSTAILALGKARSCKEPNLGWRGGLTDVGDMWSFATRACKRAVEWAGTLLWWTRSAPSVILNTTVTHYTVEPTASHCQLTSPMGE